MNYYRLPGHESVSGFGAVGGSLLTASQLNVAQRSNPVYQRQLGWSVPSGWPTTVSSAAFAERVAAYQRQHGGLVVDGMLGPKTLAALSGTVAPGAPMPGATPPAAAGFGTGWFWLAAIGGLVLLTRPKKKRVRKKRKTTRKRRRR